MTVYNYSDPVNDNLVCLHLRFPYRVLNRDFRSYVVSVGTLSLGCNEMAVH